MARVLVAIPAYGLAAMTLDLVRQLEAERELADILIVDNMGTFPEPGPEQAYRIVRPGQNLGWLGAANLGLAEAFDRGTYEFSLILNNDVRLSRHFVAGLVAAVDDHPWLKVGMVGPLLNEDVGNAQFFRYDPARYVPAVEYLETTFVHGCCLLYTRACYAVVGPKDESLQPYGWGTDVEHGYLARKAGFRCMISKRSYLHHGSQTTVRAVLKTAPSEYERQAQEHLRKVFRAKYGEAWQARLAFDFGVAP